jgi:hypothetical protein
MRALENTSPFTCNKAALQSSQAITRITLDKDDCYIGFSLPTFFFPRKKVG